MRGLPLFYSYIRLMREEERARDGRQTEGERGWKSVVLPHWRKGNKWESGKDEWQGRKTPEGERKTLEGNAFMKSPAFDK